MRVLDCGHPEACLNDADDDDVYCAWCADRDGLAAQIDILNSVLTKKAVIVTGGSPTIEGPIGLLEIFKGTVNIKNVTPATISDLGAVRQCPRIDD